MCGIAGLLRTHGGTESEPLLRTMLRAIAHRGPDDRGCWRSESGQAAFAHARLSIIDPSAAGHQPMTVGDGRFTIVYNGEIYNYTAIRKALQASGVAFVSNTDTEVILRLYEMEGPAAIERLRGMFAFAIWDERERTCFLARDRFGIKPLFYHHSGGQLLFASELRALLAAGVPPAVDATAAYHFFRSGSVPEPNALIDGVRMLEAGHHFLWKDGKVVIRRYWNLSFPEEPRPADPVALTRTALLDSISNHFVSDVPVGVFLSGGVDSTAIVALTRQFRRGELRTFSLTFPESPLDEGPEARRTAAHFGTTHHEWALHGNTARALFDDFIAAADQPSIDGFNTYCVCRLARQHDTKVVLSGVGGDELFGGYPSFGAVPKLVSAARLAKFGGALSRSAVRTAAVTVGSRVGRLEDLLTGLPSLGAAYDVFRGIYSRREARMLAAHYTGRDPVLTADEHSPPNDPTPQDTVSRLELTRYMRNQLLRDCDVMSMASGVEVRVPFVDSSLFETIAALPARERLHSHKWLLRKAVPELPEWVTNRPKRGFFLPIASWLSNEWAGTIRDPKPPVQIAMDTWYRKWAVLSFECWLRQVAPAHGR